MHILFVLEHYYPYIGGAETLFKNLCESLVEAGYEVSVVTTKHDVSLAKHETINGVKIHRLAFKNRFLFTFFSFPFLIPYIKQCDVVHTTSYNAALPAFFASRLCRKPIYITFHEIWNKLWFALPFYSGIAKLSFYIFEQLILLLSFDKYIAVSNFTAQALKDHGIKASKIYQIYNGIDYEKILAHKKNEIAKPTSFSFYGRLGASKGLDILLAALKLLKNECADFTCQLIIPKYPQAIYQAVLQEIAEYGLNKHIQLAHELSAAELYAKLQETAFVVIPSRSEGFCFVAVECAALDLPVISSARGALTETVSGKCIELRNLDSKQLKDALLQAFRSEWQEKPTKAFSITQMIESYKLLYKA